MVKTRLESIGPELTEFRHDLHRHPEASGDEVRTAARVAERLRKAGLQVTADVGGHGVVGLLQGGRPGPVLAYRADMDAVRSQAPDPAPFASLTPGVRHICGHDVHVAVGIGVAEALAAAKDELPGTIKFLFQPAEENIQGAKAMIRSGALDNPRPQAIFALHTAPLPVGTISCPTGLALPGFDLALVRLRGADDLEAASRTLAQKIGAISTVPAFGGAAGGQGPAPLRDFVLMQIDGGAKQGDAWAMTVFVRASGEAQYAKAKQAMQQVVAEAQSDRVRIELDYQDRKEPPATNDSRLVDQIAPTLRRTLGAEHALIYDGAVPYFGEDFAYYQQQVPGALCFLGVSNAARGIQGVPHAPFYQADDGAILVGARAMSNVLLDYLRSYR